MRYRFVCETCDYVYVLRKGITEPFPEHIVCKNCNTDMHQDWKGASLDVPEEMRAENIQRESFIIDRLSHGMGVSGEQNVF